MVRLRGAEGCTQASYRGVVYKADKDGIFEVPYEAISDFTRYHGFTVYVEEPNKAEKIEKLEKPAKFKKSDVLEDL